MQIHVRTTSGRCITVNIDTEFADVSDIAAYVRQHEAITGEVLFRRSGKFLSPSDVIYNHDDLDISFRICGGMKAGSPTTTTTTSTSSSTSAAAPTAGKPVSNIKGKCTIPECKKRAVLLVGDCKYCSGHFCPEHRLPEDHTCTGMDTCRAVHFNKNKDKLMSEKCVSSQV
ncbi:ubiquitinfusion protein [Pelomyxa schiedti]|nr:ubiquitinfusion protein [Pelomyxa schiedti]